MADKSDKKKKDKKDKKGKGAAKGGASVAAHPRASAAVRRAKGFGGLGGFALAALLSHKAGLAPADMVERALIAGVAGYVIAWGCAVTVWRHLVLAEMRTAADRHREMYRKRTIPMASTPSSAEQAAPEAPPAG
jgi:uncharacterized membrane protein YccC